MNRMEQGIASIPRETVIRDQPHMLAYITPAEAMLLKQNGGSGLPSHGGVPEFGLWSSTFGGGNSFEQSMQNTFGGEDGGTYEGGEWQGNDGYSPGTGAYQTSEPSGIRGPRPFLDVNFGSNQPLNAIPELGPLNSGHAARQAALQMGNSSDNDDISRAGMMGSGVNMAVNAGVISVDDGATVEPVRSGVPEFVTGEEDSAGQAMISDILKPAQYASFEPSQNNPYLYQELLNMYKNPYA